MFYVLIMFLLFLSDCVYYFILLCKALCNCVLKSAIQIKYYYSYYYGEKGPLNFKFTLLIYTVQKEVKNVIMTNSNDGQT